MLIKAISNASKIRKNENLNKSKKTILRYGNE